MKGFFTEEGKANRIQVKEELSSSTDDNFADLLIFFFSLNELECLKNVIKIGISHMKYSLGRDLSHKSNRSMNIFITAREPEKKKILGNQLTV